MSLDTALTPTTPEFSTLHICDITIVLWDDSNKWIQSIDVYIDGDNVMAQYEPKGSIETARQATVILRPPRVAVTTVRVTARLRYKNAMRNSWRNHEITIHAAELRAVQHFPGSNRKEWRRNENKLCIVVGLTNHRARDTMTSPGSPSIRSSTLRLSSSEEGRLTPTTESILRDCPRFRILVMGKTGVGKSRLINKTFGVDDAMVCHNEPGYADINREILSKENPHFILHDSKGFEHGDDLNVKTVHQFVKERSKEALVKDKLHAIWLCIDIPIDGGRLLETGIEEFLTLKMEGKLGDVPVIVVFTKYDRLIRRLNRELKPSLREGVSEDELSQLLEEKVEANLRKICIEPFEKFVRRKVPCITVSASPRYESRLADLIQLTYDHVREYFGDAAVVSAMAQRVSPRVNIQASIAVGKRKYWERLASSAHFSKKTMKECLDVIHADIIGVWRFDDPHNYLSSTEFKALISNIPQQSDHIKPPPDSRKSLAAGVSLLAGIAGIVGALSGPACPIVLPIAAAFVLGKWVYDVYRQTTDALRHLMAYIIDLTLVLQNVFWIQTLLSEGRPLSRRHIKLAANDYLMSNARQTLRFQIDKHLDSVTFDVGPDTTLKTLVALIESCTIDTSEAFKQRGNISGYSDIFGESMYTEEWED